MNLTIRIEILKIFSYGYKYTAALIDFSLARLKNQNLLEYLGGGGIVKLILQKIILCFTVTLRE